MLDHVSINVGDLTAARAFYERALEALGIGDREAANSGVHVAFAAPDRATVDRFHEAALAAGGSDNGGAGLRPHYHENYYGAFVLDPDGKNIEAVCHLPE